jgi:hypothetical protein
LLTLRELFRLPYQQTEGLGRAIAALMQASIAIPDFKSLQKRAAKLLVNPRVDLHQSGPIHVAIDSTGVKVHDAGQWQERWHQLERRREWRKLHLAINAQTQEIVAEVLTTQTFLRRNLQEPTSRQPADRSHLALQILNRFTQLGLPKFVWSG